MYGIIVIIIMCVCVCNCNGAFEISSNSLPRSRLDSTLFKEYCASLGHKVCHSFSPNAAYSHALHPLFGRIR